MDDQIVAQTKTDLFNGTKFWLSRSVPRRSSLIQQVKDHGGVVVSDSPYADILIVDPARSDNPVNSYSYHYLERSITKNKLADLEDYRAGLPPGTSRPLGSSSIRARRIRTSYTAAEEAKLREYVHECERQGKKIFGQKIYQEFELLHPEHSWQSWRERYVRHIAPKYDAAGHEDMALELEPSSKSAQKATQGIDQSAIDAAVKLEGQRSKKRRRSEDDAGAAQQAIKRGRDDSSTPVPQMQGKETTPSTPNNGTTSRALGGGFTAEETEELLSHVEHLLLLNPSEEDEFLDEFAATRNHTADEYRSHFYDVAIPEYHKRRFSKIKLPKKTVKPTTRSQDMETTNQEEATTNTSPLRLEVLERDTPRQSAETPIGAEQDVGEDEGSLRLLSQEPISSWEGEQPQMAHVAEDVVAEGVNSDNGDSDLEQQIDQGLNGEAKEEDKEADSDSDAQSDTTTQGPEPRQPSIEIGGSGIATREKTPLTSSTTPSQHPQTQSHHQQHRHQKSTTEPEEEEEETRKIETWLTAKCAQYSLTNPAPVIEALLCTSVSLDIADKIVPRLVEGQGVPRDMPGVWTQEDDMKLRSGGPKSLKAVERKHGVEGVVLRREYLRNRERLDDQGLNMINGL